MQRAVIISVALTTCLVVPTWVRAAAPPARDQIKQPEPLAQIADALEAIRSEMEKAQVSLVLDRQVSALVALDKDISTLSSDLQKTRDDRDALDANSSRLRAISEAGGSMTVVERSQLRASKDSLDQLSHRVEELEATILRRKAELYGIEKIVRSLVGLQGT